MIVKKRDFMLIVSIFIFFFGAYKLKAERAKDGSVDIAPLFELKDYDTKEELFRKKVVQTSTMREAERTIWKLVKQKVVVPEKEWYATEIEVLVQPEQRELSEKRFYQVVPFKEAQDEMWRFTERGR